MDFELLTAVTAADLKTAIRDELSGAKATEIVSTSIAVYNGSFYCLLVYKKPTT